MSIRDRIRSRNGLITAPAARLPRISETGLRDAQVRASRRSGYTSAGISRRNRIDYSRRWATLMQRAYWLGGGACPEQRTREQRERASRHSRFERMHPADPVVRESRASVSPLRSIFVLYISPLSFSFLPFFLPFSFLCARSLSFPSFSLSLFPSHTRDLRT